MDFPKIFYKYLTPDTAIKVIETGRFRWSSPLGFNDPSEFQRMPIFSPSMAESFPLLTDTLLDAVYDDSYIDINRLSPMTRATYEFMCLLRNNGVPRDYFSDYENIDFSFADGNMDEGLRDFFDKLDISKARVFCVTEDYGNEAMWANYADNHKGVVIGLKHVYEADSPLLAARKVSYSEYQPVLGSGLDFLLYGDEDLLRSKTVDAVLFTKKHVWSYEKEWRVISWVDDDIKTYSDYRFHPDEVESITIGMKADSGYADGIKKMCAEKYPHAQVYRLHIKNGEVLRLQEES